MKYLYNDRHLRDRRRELRKNMTAAETVLWGYVRMRRIKGFKFLRQYFVGPYILDFFCVEIQLGIEVDGESHGNPDGRSYDVKRSDFLSSHGIQLLRFWNDEILCNHKAVIARIEERTAAIKSPPPRM